MALTARKTTACRTRALPLGGGVGVAAGRIALQRDAVAARCRAGRAERQCLDASACTASTACTACTASCSVRAIPRER